MNAPAYRRSLPGKRQVVLITGITGQDGSYLAELLIKKGYSVFGAVRKTSQFNGQNLSKISSHINFVHIDLLDFVSIREALRKIQPDEIYNLASQSHAGESFRQPIYTAEVTGIGVHRMIDAFKDICPQARFYQASSSEMFGVPQKTPQNEGTSFNPTNPYAAAKIYAHNISRIYRESHDLFISCGILFNHESPRRGFNFVTQKICYAAACAGLGIKTSKQLNEEGEPIIKSGKVSLGNLDTRRDWGFAGDYVEAMYLMLQQSEPDDFVISTGSVHTIEQLCQEAFSHVGLDFRKYVLVDQRFVRPAENGLLVGDYSKARRVLGWEPKVAFKELVGMMVDSNISRIR